MKTALKFLMPGRPASRAALILWVACALAGCSTLGYYSQAIGGHWSLMQARRPLPEVITDAATPDAVRRKLALAQAARAFASARLGLPANDSYTEYAALERRYVVWNVFAAPALSLELKESCFLFVGCVSYRGYFSEQAADAAGATLRAAGYDVFVGGVAAYSTLGWFADPLVSSMLNWEDAVLVKTIFHELAHQRLYIADDSAFNESFATAVAEFGFARWRAETELGASVTASQSHEREFIALVLRHQRALQAWYRRPLTDAEKLLRKARQMQRLRDEFAALSRNWADREDYARWLAHDLNNAKLASVGTYYRHVPAFTALLHHLAGDLPHFYAAAEALGRTPRAARAACLRALAGDGAALPAACDGRLGSASSGA